MSVLLPRLHVKSVWRPKEPYARFWFAKIVTLPRTPLCQCEPKTREMVDGWCDERYKSFDSVCNIRDEAGTLNIPPKRQIPDENL